MAYHETSLAITKTLWYFDFKKASGEAGKIGEGQPGNLNGRDRVDEYQLLDLAVADHHGPNLVFAPRGEYWQELSDRGLKVRRVFQPSTLRMNHVSHAGFALDDMSPIAKSPIEETLFFLTSFWLLTESNVVSFDNRRVEQIMVAHIIVTHDARIDYETVTWQERPMNNRTEILYFEYLVTSLPFPQIKVPALNYHYVYAQVSFKSQALLIYGWK
ncbi:hypothetical protein BOTNAR_0441g00010 [Botryotinia narcissicola]|uniref:Uncharacterized protein n=1 Tax=Botryotinia narcissicola TaxID=278944 RepID=A0A4Z1HJD5_9HELO|nr:hypothetical protein BOTNAR_0441g00010 [Botryotinia narcissicola]